MELLENTTDKRRLFGRWFARRITSPHYWWVVWVMAGWGLNLILSLVWYLTGCDKDKDYR